MFIFLNDFRRTIRWFEPNCVRVMVAVDSAALQVALEVCSYLLHLSLVATGAGHDDAMWRLN